MTAPTHSKLVPISAILLAAVLFFAILTVHFDGAWTDFCSAAILFTLAAAWSVRLLIAPAPTFPLRLHPALLPLAAIILLGTLQLAASTTISRWATASDLLRWVAYATAFTIALQLGAHPGIRRHFLTALWIFGLLFSAVAAVQYLSDPSKIFGLLDPPYSGNWLGPFSNKDHYASFLQLLLPLALYQAFSEKRRLIPGAVIAALMFASVIEGASRAGSFLIVAETVVTLVLAYRRRLPAARTPFRTFILPGALIAVLTVSIGWTRLWERAHEADPYLARQQILQSCLNMIRERPLIGFGLGNFENAYPRFAIFDDGEIVGHAHNDWVEWTVEGGLPFTLLILAVVILSARALWRSLWGIGVLFVLTHCLIDFPMHRSAIALWTFTLLGLACGALEKTAISRATY